jgi:hypothetical protein
VVKKNFRRRISGEEFQEHRKCLRGKESGFVNLAHEQSDPKKLGGGLD